MDDVLLGTFPFEPSEEFTGVLLRGTRLAYAARYDKFSVNVTGR